MKNRTKKITALLLCALLIASVPLPAAATQGDATTAPAGDALELQDPSPSENGEQSTPVTPPPAEGPENDPEPDTPADTADGAAEDDVDELTVGTFGLPAPPASGENDLTHAIIAINGSYSYTGAAITPDITVTLGLATLSKGADYTVTCYDNINAGMATVEVTGAGTYTGSASTQFNVARAVRPTPPPAPKLLTKTATSVTLLAQPGIEYTSDIWSNFWDEHGVFGVVSGGHNFYARYAETANYMPSEPSAPLYVSVEQEQLTENQIPQPGGIRFNGLLLEWRQTPPEGAPHDWDCRYELQIMRDGATEIHYPHDIPGDIKHLWMDEGFETSGSYELYLVAYDLYDEYAPSTPVVIYFDYVKPSAKMSPPTPTGWEVEGAAIYMNAEDTDNADKTLGWWEYLFEVAEPQPNGEYSTVYRHWSSDLHLQCSTRLLSNKKYMFRVRALSGDMFRWYHSDWSGWSGILDLSDEIITVEGTLKSLIAQLDDGAITAAEALDEILTLDKGELRLAMQTDDELLAIVEAIEAAYMADKGINVGTEVAPVIAAKLNGGVSVVGAGLNSAGGDVTLNLESKKENVEIDSRYMNYVQLSIDIAGVPDSSDLAVPLRITMPIPIPLSTNRLVIMHYTDAQTFESVPFVQNGDGTISFTITHLSEFVFALEPYAVGDTIVLSEAAPAASGNGWNYSNNVYTILNGADVVLSGYTSTRRVEIAANATATVTLAGISISASAANTNPLRLLSGANLTLIVEGDDYPNIFLSTDSARAAIRVPTGTSLTITGNGTLKATGGTNSASIGGNPNEACGTININGGYVTASGAGGMGIGAGTGSSGHGTFNMNGNAFVFAATVGDTSAKLQGVLFIGNSGTVYGSVVPPSTYTDIGSRTLTVPNGTTLTINLAQQLKNSGTIIPADGSTVAASGSVITNKINGANVGIPAVSGTPTMRVITASSVSLLAATGQVVEYAIGTSPTPLESNWQGNATFTGLTPDTNYYVYARSKENGNFAAGTASVSAAIKTAAPPTQVAPQAITGIVVPLGGNTPSSVINGGNGFTATLTWENAPTLFEYNSTYTAIIILTAEAGYTFEGYTADNISGFTVAGNTPTLILASNSALFLSVTLPTAKATLTGSAGIIGSPRYGELLTADITSLAPAGMLGEVSYTWKRGITVLGTEATYTVTQADIGSAITLTITASNCTGSQMATTLTVDKASGPAAPTVTGSYTGDGTTFTYTITPVINAEYKMDSGNWQGSNIFTGITPLASHTFYARIKGSATHESGAEGSTNVTFNKLPNSMTPALNYTVSGPDNNRTITIDPVAGAEYKFGTDTWGDGGSKGGYTTADTVTIYIRYAATFTHDASAHNSAPVNLAKLNQTPPPAFSLSRSYVSGSYIVTIPTLANCEYSFDGTTYSDTANTTTAAPGTAVTGYRRYKGSDTHNPSPATTATLTLPNPVTSVTVTAVGGAAGISTRGGTLQLLAVIAPAQATQTVTWSVQSGSSYATVSSGGLVTAKGNGTAVIRATATDGTGIHGEISLAISGQGGGGGSGGGGGGSSSGGARTDTSGAISTPTEVSRTLTYGADASGRLIMAITKSMVEEEIAAAKLKWAGRESYGIAISFVNSTAGVSSLSATIEAAAIDHMVAQKLKAFIIRCGIFRITLDEQAIGSLDTQSVGTVTLTVRPRTVAGAAATAVGYRPVYEVTFTDSRGVGIQSFGTGKLTSGIKYAPTAAEKTGNLFAVRANGTAAEWITKSSYTDGWVIWTGNSCSVYGVGYRYTANYADTTGHVARVAIDYAVSRGLMANTAAGFLPDTPITRADVAVALGKLYGANVSGYTASSFSDVAATSAAMPYIEWATKNSIMQGSGGKFAPTGAVTREQLAVIVQSYAKQTGYTLPVVRQYYAFADDSGIASTARGAVRAVAQVGIMAGTADNKFNPQRSATRAEVAAVLHRYTELVIDAGTARGWVKNEAGSTMYYSASGVRNTGWLNIANSQTKYYFDAHGAMVTGKWLQISGKWYYFYADGKLAVNTVVGSYTVDKDGARKT